MKIKLAENIRMFRKEHSLTQEQLAEVLGVTVGAVYKWKAGLSMPEIRLIIELARFFEVSVDVLLGYEQQNNHIEAVLERMEQRFVEKDFAGAIEEAERAMKKYPNHFDLVHQTALLYKMRFLEDKQIETMERSNELFSNAISLLYQNTDYTISEVTIRNHIAENLLLIEKTQEALGILKQNNVCGINDSQIGLIYAMIFKRPQEAREYLTKAFANGLKTVFQVVTGMTEVYKMQKQTEQSKEALLWLIDFLDSIKEPGKEIVCTDKIKACLLTQCAIAEAKSTGETSVCNYLKEAYLLARRFDETPEFGVKGIRFFDEEEIEGIMFDDLESTAILSMESLILQIEEEQTRNVMTKMWEKLKKENE